MIENQRKAGVALSYASMLINIAIGLISVPLMNHFMGKSEYGIYELMGSLIAYMSVMDFGLSATITRYYSQAMAKGDTKARENILGISSVIYMVIAGITIVAGLLLYGLLDVVYAQSLTSAELISAKQIFIVVIINMAVTIPSHIFTAVITSYEKFIFLRGVTMVSQALQPIAYILVLMRHPTAFAVVVTQTAFNFAVILLNVFYTNRKLHVKIRLHTFDRSLVREMLGFSFFIFLNAVIDQLYWKTDVLVLGAVAGGTLVTGIYGIASRVTTMYTNFSSTANSVFLPKITTLCTQNAGMQEINGIFKSVGRVQFLVMSMILSGFICFGQDFMMLWAGKNYSADQKISAYYICLIIMIPLIIPLVQNIGITILQAKNKHAFRSIVYLIIAIVKVLLSIPMAKLYGGIGCAIATSSAMIVGNIIIINIYYKKVIHLDVGGFFREIGKLLPVTVVVIVLGCLLNYMIPATNYLILIAEVLLFIALFFGFSWRFSMNRYEKQLIGGVLSKIFHKMKR